MLSGTDALAIRASKKLRNDELLLTAFGGSRLRMELDRIPLWRGDSVAVKQLAEDFARYLYLPRLADPSVLVSAIRDGVALLTWPQDSFAYAESYDESAGRYRGLCSGRNLNLADHTAAGLLVKPEVALKQIDAEAPAPGGNGGATKPEGERPKGGAGGVWFWGREHQDGVHSQAAALSRHREFRPYACWS